MITTTLNVGRPYRDCPLREVTEWELIVIGFTEVLHEKLLALPLIKSCVSLLRHYCLSRRCLAAHINDTRAGGFFGLLEAGNRNGCEYRPAAAVTVLHAFEAPLVGKMRLYDLSHEKIEAYRAQVRAERTSKMHQLTLRRISREVPGHS